jgi:hypothetical protein
LLRVAKLLEGANAVGIEIELASRLEPLGKPNAKSSSPFIIKILVKIDAHMKYLNVCHL